MIVSLDTNALQALFDHRHMHRQHVGLEIERLQVLEAHLIVCPVVYAECHGIPGFERTAFLQFLQNTGMTLDPSMPLTVWERAGEAQVAYHERRKRENLSQPKRVLPDFLIGAHALERGAALLTLDSSGYRAAFRDLELLP